MTPFHVGMPVVCVDDEWRGLGVQSALNIPCPLSLGSKYTIKEIRIEHGVSWVIGESLCATLREVSHPNPQSGFAIDRFRPAHENRMDELRTLLAPVPSKELVQS